MKRTIETIQTQLVQELDALSLIEAFAFAATIQEYVVSRATAEQAELQSEELWAPESVKVRRMLARELDRLPSEHSFALLGDLLVCVCLNGETTVEGFEGVLDLFAQCKEEVEQKPS